MLRRMFMLKGLPCPISSCPTENAAIMHYKHTILQFLEYAAFMLISCNIDDRRDLQKCKNDALRILC